MAATAPSADYALQHVIDPEVCIRCNTCEATCPVGAVTHDSRNYVVDFTKCNACNACLPPCPTGAIDHWLQVRKTAPYTLDDQLSWDALPPQQELEVGAQADVPDDVRNLTEIATSGQGGPSAPPWSASHPYVNLYTPARPAIATVTGNHRLTADDASADIRHLVLDFGNTAFPVLEGQTLGVLPPGAAADGRPHAVRLYSVASPRDGERPRYNNVSLTIKRVLEDHQGRPVRGVASNYLCDLQVGDTVRVTGPFGASFLMPNHPRSNIVMICTGTGSAPMRAMTEWRRRLRKSGKFEGGKLLLFFGARTPEELPYFGPLQNLPKDFIDINFAFSRVAGQPKRYVQDAMRERAPDLAALLDDGDSFFYVCGLKAMEEGVVLALRDVAVQAGLDWGSIGARLKREGRLHLETY